MWWTQHNRRQKKAWRQRKWLPYEALTASYETWEKLGKNNLMKSFPA